MEKKIFYSANAVLFQKAKELRDRLTGAEKILWVYLRTKPKGCKFRQQHPAQHYILDFYCHSLRLAIEADGSVYNTKEAMRNDLERQKNLEAAGIRFVRFTNEEIMEDLDSVIEKIDCILDECQEKMAGADQHFFEPDDRK